MQSHSSKSMICLKCKKAFEAKQKLNKNIYCSRACFLADWKRAKGITPWNKGKKIQLKHKKQFKNGCIPWNKGKKLTVGMVGEKHWNWKGGITGERQALMSLSAYKDWRTAVFKRDNYTCTECRKNNVFLEADHIKPWCNYPNLRYDVDNGRTLCRECHRKIGWTLFRENNPKKLAAVAL